MDINILKDNSPKSENSVIYSPSYCSSVTLSNFSEYFFYASQKQESHTGLEQQRIFIFG